MPGGRNTIGYITSEGDVSLVCVKNVIETAYTEMSVRWPYSFQYENAGRWKKSTKKNREGDKNRGNVIKLNWLGHDGIT